MPGAPWSNQEKRALRRQVRREKRALADVTIDGRTIHSIRSQAVRLDLVEKRTSRAKWSAAERRRLRELKDQGFAPTEIAAFGLLSDPPRSRWSITKQWGRMKLANRRRSRLMRRKKRWALGEKERFREYLLKHSAVKTPEEIAKIWGIARSTVARCQQELGVKATRERVLQMKYSQAKQRRARTRIQSSSRRMWERRRALEIEKLQTLADEMRAANHPPIEQVCADCQRSWPRRREFFHIREKKISMGTSRYYKRRCVLCENIRRRNKNGRAMHA